VSEVEGGAMATERSSDAVNQRWLDSLRRERGSIAEHVIDEFVAGRLTRREFLRRGTAVGLSAPFLGAFLRASGGASLSTPFSASASKAKAGATIRPGILEPAAAINPITTDDPGGTQILGQMGEWLVFTDESFNYHPWLATSWSPNADATEWTFKLQERVTFNDGTPMTADDVVYSFQTQCNPKTGAAALSVFSGTLVPDGVVKVDDYTVAFHLESPDASFVDAVSPNNYNMVIVPNGYDYSNYQSEMPGTGRFMKTSYTPNVGVTFVRNPHYWGTPALPEKLEFTFYAGDVPMTTALEAQGIDCNGSFSVATSPQLLRGGFNVIAVRASAHRELSMRNDIPPFTNKYVRQALALTLDRPGLVKGLFKGYAEVGNDSPFAPIFRATVGPPAVPQRTQNLKLAKQLLAKAGVPRGFSTPLYTEQYQEMPEFAEFIKSYAGQIGVDISLNVESITKYFGSSTIGSSDWLDGPMSLVDYGARAVPNVYLEAPLQTYNKKTGQGAWNAARFNNATYDKLSKDYVAAVDLSSQRRLAKQIELLLLDETPIIYPFFYDGLTATLKNIHGVFPTVYQLFFWNAWKS